MSVAVAPARTITAEEQATVQAMLARARAAMRAVEAYDQAAVDRLCRAIAWAGGNEETATRLAKMSVEESGMGSPEPKRRAKVQGILRDALRQKSMGVIEEIPEKGITKYAKPAGVIASLIPVTSPYVTPIGIAIYAVKCKDAVIFSPHPASKKATNEAVRVMRAALRKLGAPEDLLQCVERPSIPLAKELMSVCDLTIATGGPAMVKAAYSSGKPAFGVGAGNATMVVDETANVEEAARNTRISKTNDHGSGCSADGNLVVDASIYDALLAQLQKEGGYLVNADEKRLNPPVGAHRAREPHHGAAGAVGIECRHVHQRHADDVEHGLRHLGRQRDQREYLAQALHERDMGEPSDSRGPAVRAGAVRRVLQQRDLLTLSE
jgi:sulfoacetaldehyde dehydrogenase